MNLSGMTIGKRISLGFGVVLAMLLLLSMNSFIGTSKIVENAKEVIEGGQLNAELMQREIDHLNWVGKVTGALVNGGIELNVETDPHKCGFGKWYYGGGHEHAENLLPALKPLFDEIEEPHKKLHESAVAIKASLDGGGTKEALAIYTAQTLPALKSVQGLMGKIREEARGQLISDKEMLDAAAKTRMLAGVISFMSLVFGFVVAFFIIRGISATLKQVTHSLIEGAEQVSTASGEVSSASQALAEGASRQAAAEEQTSAAIEEVRSMVTQDADNALQADKLMKDANTVILRADESMKKLTTSMQEIATASTQTQKIVKTIDEIAFQTNLLALNAAVEAARAGEAGAGFAVVADEVRNLAMRAAEAAKNTSELIEGTVQKINTGSTLVKETSESFNVAAESTSRIGTIISEIAGAASQQASAISEVTKAILEIDSVTQSNAAAAEEAAAASEELNAQAEMMKGSVGQLLAMVDGVGMGAGSARGRNASPKLRQLKQAAPMAGKLSAPKKAAPPTRKALPSIARKPAASSKPEDIIPRGENFEDF